MLVKRLPPPTKCLCLALPSLGTYIFLKILFSKTLKFDSFESFNDQVSHRPYIGHVIPDFLVTGEQLQGR